MNNLFRKTLLASAVTIALAAASSGAMAATFPDFVVNEGSIVGALPTSFTADKITGNYVEVITFSGANTFDVALKFQAGQFVANDGTTPINNDQLGGSTANQYQLYALYKASGTTSVSGTVTTFNVNPGGSLQLFSDANSDTQFVQPSAGTSAFTTTAATNTDDVLLATGAPLSGQGTLEPNKSTCGSNATGGQGIDCGSFGNTVSFGLTADGSNYFTSPSPFYNLSFQSGQLNNFDASGTQVINGSLDLIFNSTPNVVPEPTTVALLGLGLLGFAASRRKSAKNNNA